jgi:hypothetical protein
MLEFRPFSGVTPKRDIVLASRRDFPRPGGARRTGQLPAKCELPDVEWANEGEKAERRGKAKPMAPR